MKTKVKISYILLLSALVLVFGCSDEFQDITPQSSVSEESVWVDEGLASAAVTNIYNGLDAGGLGEQMLASLSDEANFTHTGRGINTVNESRANSNDTGWISSTHAWANMYRFIRAANVAVKNLEGGSLEASGISDRLIGEALFLRAYYYHQLVRNYGGVPLISEPFDLDSEYNVPRNSFEECVNFIVADCDKAYTLLNGESMDGGRANATAALALKARILLYAASDLHDIPTASANSSLISGYGNKELLGYDSGQDARWQAAKNATKAILDAASGYELGLASPAPLDKGEENYTNIHLARNGGESELIFEREYVSTSGGWGGIQIGLFNGPNGYHNWAGNTPLQNLIDAYGMTDGSEFDWDNPAQSSAPYENRDPRFYSTILYDGADWKPRPDDVTDRDPNNQIQTGQYELPDGTTHFGLDTRQGPVEDWNGSRSGYYCKKFVDPDVIDQDQQNEVPWPFFRYTEFVLNYVEALLEADNNEAEAKLWLNKIRFRAGMPAITASGSDLVDAYRKERQVELAYEEHRYYDARRWMIAESTLGAPARIIQITGALKAGATVDKYAYDPTKYDYTYTPTTLDPGFENRLWLDKNYFLPIREAELNAATSLVQNPGYD